MSSLHDSKAGAMMDEKAPPPPYQDVASHGQLTNMEKPMTMANPLPQQIQPQQTFRFPEAFGIYHAPSSFSNMLLALSKDDPAPLNYVSTHNGLSSQPSVVLHSTRSESSPPLATADFHTFSSSIDLNLFLGPQPQTTSLILTGAFSATRSFTVFVPSTNKIEAFEWRNSSGNEVRHLGGRSHGKKCVRVATGEVVAAFTYPDLSYSKKGKIMWLRDRAVLGQACEIMVVLALLAIIEKRRRQKNSNGAAAGGAGA